MNAQSKPDALLDRRIAAVSADALYRLVPFLGSRDDCIFRRYGGQNLWGWHVEPCAAGGVLIFATDGRVAGVIHDPTGKATGPVTILASEGLRKAVAPPPKVTVYYPGDYDEEDLPDRYQPHTVVAMGLFVAVYDAETCDEANVSDLEGEGRALYVESAEEGADAGGYRLADEYVPWRKPFDGWKNGATTPSHQRLDPRLYNAFSRIGHSTLEMYVPEDDLAPTLVLDMDQADFAGLIMRGDRKIRPAPEPKLPDWFAPAPTVTAEA